MGECDLFQRQRRCGLSDTGFATDRLQRLRVQYCLQLARCGECLGACPVGLPIDTVLRYDMYYADYRREALAREKYAKLAAAGLDAGACAACPAPCAGACPYELPIRAKMVRAHERLARI